MQTDFGVVHFAENVTEMLAIRVKGNLIKGTIICRKDLNKKYINISGKNSSVDDWKEIQTADDQPHVMRFDPGHGNPSPYPPMANDYRRWHGNVAWLYNPWTGKERHPLDIGSDVFGFLIVSS